MSEVTKPDLRDRLGNIDQIRDILVGSQLREFSNRLQQAETSLSVLHQDIRTRTEELKQVLSAELQASAESLEKRIKTLSQSAEQDKAELQAQIDTLSKRVTGNTNDVKQLIYSEVQNANASLDKRLNDAEQKDAEEKTDLRQQIDRLSARLTTTANTLDDSIDKQTGSLRDDLLSSREKLQEDLLGLRNQVFEELEKRFGDLTNAKVARADFAEMLFELGMRLKGTEFVPELQEVTNAEGGNYLTGQG